MVRKRFRPEQIVRALAILFFGIFLVVFLRGRKDMKPDQSTRVIKVWVNDMPISADPYDYDTFIHIISFGSVFSTLVSQYRLGEHLGMLAKSWKVSKDQTEWTFFLRKDVHFDNGEIITPEHIISSWLRMARKMRTAGSESGFFDKLIGWEKFRSNLSNLPGIAYDTEKIHLKFKKPFPKFLDTISFGIYSVVHPSQYHEDGKWIKDAKIIASGPYSVVRWDNRKLILKFREDFPKDLHHPRPLRNIELIWDAKQRLSCDIFRGTSRDEIPDKSYKFHGSVGSKIAYIRCMSWKDPSSLCHKKEVRTLLRDVFYEGVEKGGTNITRSFFPLVIRGVSKFKSLSLSSERLRDLGRQEIRFWDYAPAFYTEPEDIKKARYPYHYLGHRLGIQLTPIEMKFSEIFKYTHLENDPDKIPVDLANFSTGILVDDPDADIRFIFKFEKGVRLPDATGEILAELDKEPLDIQKINTLLWDQAIIWPLYHYSGGLWAKPEIDFSMINLVLPPTAFNWLGWKE